MTKRSTFLPYIWSLCSVLLILLSALPFREHLAYRILGYILLLNVSLLSIRFRIRPVLLATILSVGLLDFLFVKPYYTLHVHAAEDAFMLLTFLGICLIHVVFTHRFKKLERQAQLKVNHLKTMQLYTTLLHSLSHELRTPMATVMAGIDSLQSTPLNEAQRSQVLDHMMEASQRLNRQVDHLLQMSRLESGVLQVHSDWCDLRELVFNAWHLCSSQAQGRHIQFQGPELLPLFKTDAGLMEQIFYNLLYNFILYTPPGARMQVELTFDPQVLFDEADPVTPNCLLRFADDGYGIEADPPDLVFDKFYRGHPERAGGTGLGLAIVKGFVEALHGQVRVYNLPEGGACFECAFTLPYYMAPLDHETAHV